MNPFALKPKKGFTLAETIASMIALGVISMSAQSIIMISNKFNSKSNRSLSSLEHQNTFHNLVCSSMSHPVAVQTDRSRTFYWDGSKYKKVSDISPTQPATLAYLIPNGGLTAPTGHSAGTISDSSLSSNILTDVKLYKIYGDSHTLISFSPSTESIDATKFQMGDVQENSGMIIATRCIENETHSASTRYRFIDAEKGSVLDDSDGSATQSTDGTLLYILNNPRRPFFFEDAPKIVDKIKCCDISEPSTFTEETEGDKTVKATSCANLSAQTPVTYVIKFNSMGSDDIKDDEGEPEPSGNGRADIIDYLTNSNTDGGGDSLEAFCETNILAKNTYDAAYSASIDADDSDIDAATKAAEKACLDRHYYPTVFQEFSIPVSESGLQITELPIIKNLAQELWSTTFIASSFGSQSSAFNLKLLDIKNTCHTSEVLKGCLNFPPNKKLNQTITGTSRTMSDFLAMNVRTCHFRYAKEEQTSSYIPMGFTYGE